MAKLTCVRRAALFLLGFWGLRVLGADSKSKCYYPNGSVSRYDIPCSDAEQSHCCGDGSICLSNGYCLDLAQPYTPSRGSCTDKTWESSSCPDECRDCYPSGGCAILVHEIFVDRTAYCCGGIKDDNGSLACLFGDPVSLPDGVIIGGKAALSDYVSATSTTTSSAAESSGGTATAHAETTSVGATNESDSDGLNKTTKKSSNDIAIGAGVGVPLGVIAIASLVWALWERRRAAKMQAVMAQHGVQMLDEKGAYHAPHLMAAELPGEQKPAELQHAPH